VLVRDAAYESLLRSRRRDLHARIAEVLEARLPDRAEREPELLARHCAEAGLAEKAATYRLLAGRQALARSALAEAVAQLRAGLDALAGPAGRARPPPAGAGSASGPRRRADRREGLRGPRNVSSPRPRPRALPGRGRPAPSLSRAERLGGVPRRGGQAARGARDRGGDAGTSGALGGHRPADPGTPGREHGGAAPRALRCDARAVLALYDPARHRPLASVYSFDQRSVALSYIALALLMLGYPDQARSRGEELLAWCSPGPGA
jgi:hypothetical protein